MNRDELVAQYKQKVLAAKELAESDADKAESLIAEATELKSKLEALDRQTEIKKQADGLMAELQKPIYPADLPMGDGVEESTKQNDPQPNPIYIMKYGEMGAAVKQVATELYGGNYYEQVDGQTEAFKAYVRAGEKHLSVQDEKMLKTVVFTPGDLQVALSEGQNVKYLKNTMLESVGELGGFAVPPQIANTVISRLGEPQTIRSRANVMQTSRQMMEIIANSGGDDRYAGAVRVSPVEENPSSTPETNMTLERHKIEVHTIKATAPLSKNLIEDQAVNLIAELTRQMAEALAVAETEWFLIGNGVNVPLGVLPGGTTLTTGVTEVNSGNASALTWDGLIALKRAVKGRYRVQGQTGWVMNSDTTGDIETLKTTDGAYLWTPYQTVGGQDGMFDRLQRFDVLEQEIMPDVAAGTYPIVFGNWTGYTIVDHIGGMSIQRFDDSYTDNTNTVRYTLRRRFGGQVTEPWKFAVQKVSA